MKCIVKSIVLWIESWCEYRYPNRIVKFGIGTPLPWMLPIHILRQQKPLLLFKKINIASQALPFQKGVPVKGGGLRPHSISKRISRNFNFLKKIIYYTFVLKTLLLVLIWFILLLKIADLQLFSDVTYKQFEFQLFQIYVKILFWDDFDGSTRFMLQFRMAAIWSNFDVKILRDVYSTKTS